MATNYTSQQRTTSGLMLKYGMRYRMIYTDLISNGYFGVFAKQEALEAVVKEYVAENPDVSPDITCKVFFLIGDLSGLMKSTPKFEFDPNYVKDVFNASIIRENKTDEK
jgi:hypothetical protein